MKSLLSKETKLTIKKLAEIQRDIIGDVEIVDHETVHPNDVYGVGLGWAAYGFRIRTETGFTVISAINSDADFVFVLALGSGNSDLAEHSPAMNDSQLLWNPVGNRKSKKQICANLILRLAQIGLGELLPNPKLVHPLDISSPFSLLWANLLLRYDCGRGKYIIAAVDHTGKNVFVHLQGWNEMDLHPKFVEFGGNRKAPDPRYFQPAYRSDDIHSPALSKIPDWHDESEFADDRIS